MSCRALWACLLFCNILGLVNAFHGAFLAAVGGFGLLKTVEVSTEGVAVEGPGTGKSSIRPSSNDQLEDGLAATTSCSANCSSMVLKGESGGEGRESGTPTRMAWTVVIGYSAFNYSTKAAMEGDTLVDKEGSRAIHAGAGSLFILIGPVIRTPSLWSSVILVFQWFMLCSMNVISTWWILYIWRHLIIRERGALSEAFLSSILVVDTFLFLGFAVSEDGIIDHQLVFASIGVFFASSLFRCHDGLIP